MEIGLTALIQKRVKDKLSVIVEKDLFFCWETQIIRFNNRNVLLIVNASNRFTKWLRQ